MNKTFFNILFLCSSLLFFTLSDLYSQDSSQSKSQQLFSSFGFQASWVSGTGITYCYTSNDIRYRVTGGWIKSEDESVYTFGFDVHYYLANAPGFNLFLGPSFGIYGSSTESTNTRLALATCFEAPIISKEKRNNLCAGIILYYPAYYFSSSTLNPTAGIYVLYNF
jgi:hypothetical protein